MGNSNEIYIEEKNLKDSPISIPTTALKVITDLADKCICKITNNKKEWATGFFCAIPFPDKYQRLPVIITNNHVLKSSDIKEGEKIKFSMNNNKNSFELEIDNKRKVYTNEKYDITIIEVRNSDNINTNSFLDIDEDVFNKKFKEIYIKDKKSVYLLHYRNEFSEYTSGIIKAISEDNYSIRHSCQTQQGS